MSNSRLVGTLLMAIAAAGLAAGGAAIVAPVWAQDRYWYLMAVGAALPILIVAWIDTDLWLAGEKSRLKQRDADTQFTLARADELWAKSSPPAPVIELPIDTQIDALTRQREFQLAHWAVFYRRIYAAGTAYGWDQRTLTDPRRTTRVMSQPAWNVGTDQLAAAGVIFKDRVGTRVIVPEADWNENRMWEKVPCPAGDPPDIMPPPYSKQYAPQQAAQNHAVIENG